MALPPDGHWNRLPHWDTRDPRASDVQTQPLPPGPAPGSPLTLHPQTSARGQTLWPLRVALRVASWGWALLGGREQIACAPPHARPCRGTGDPGRWGEKTGSVASGLAPRGRLCRNCLTPAELCPCSGDPPSARVGNPTLVGWREAAVEPEGRLFFRPPPPPRTWEALCPSLDPAIPVVSRCGRCEAGIGRSFVPLWAACLQPGV